MEVVNRVVPSEAQMKGFFEPGRDGPIWMLNLLKFKQKAEYEDGREISLSGQEAYAIYGMEVAKLLQEVGGAHLFSARVERLMLGEVEELWDAVAIAMYPSRSAMFKMISSEKYQEIAVHRTAGLAGQLNIETGSAAGTLLGQAGDL